MSSFDQNPFADPFADPSIAQATNRNVSKPNLDEYNPFDGKDKQKASEPAVLQTSSAGHSLDKKSNQTQPPPPAYTPETVQTMTPEYLLKRQEELERKAAEIAAREEALRNARSDRANNWPPLPEFCPVGPCFYHDINVEIPIEFQKIVRYAYYLWMGYIVVLITNMLGGLAIAISKKQFDILKMSIMLLLFLSPLSFLCWFRPLYKAFRDDSSFNFVVFFFVFFCQLVLSILWAIGIPSLGSCGYIKGLIILANRKTIGDTLLSIAILFIGAIWSIFVLFGIIMMLKSGLLTAINHLSNDILLGSFLFLVTIVLGLYAAASFLVLIRVHSIYRRSGNSLFKAQGEFTQGILNNEHIQQVASAAAASAARSAMNETFGTGKNDKSGTRTKAGLRY